MKYLLKNILCVIMAIGFHFLSYANIKCEDPFFLNQDFYKIEYGTTLNVEVVNKTNSAAIWQIKFNGVVFKQGMGNQTGSVEFNEPGLYTLDFQLVEGEENSSHSTKAKIEVVSTKIEFLLNQAVFSKEILAGTDLQGTILKIPVKVNSFNNQKLNYGPTKSVSTGFAELVATYVGSSELSPGLHELHYEISGVAPEKGAAQFAFFNTVESGTFLNILIK